MSSDSSLSNPLKEQLHKVFVRVEKAGGKGVRIVAAVKSQNSTALRNLLDLGISDFGESYVQEFLARGELLTQNIKWHLIGQLQTNKVKHLPSGKIALFQSVDRKSLIDQLAKHFPGNEILLQLDTTGNPARGGVPADQVSKLMEEAVSAGLKPKGIMLIAQKGIESSIQDFRQAKKLQESLGLEILSAGMSDDFELALGEGSNMIRLGKILFENNSGN